MLSAEPFRSSTWPHSRRLYAETPRRRNSSNPPSQGRRTPPAGPRLAPLAVPNLCHRHHTTVQGQLRAAHGGRYSKRPPARWSHLYALPVGNLRGLCRTLPVRLAAILRHQLRVRRLVDPCLLALVDGFHRGATLTGSLLRPLCSLQLHREAWRSQRVRGATIFLHQSHNKSPRYPITSVAGQSRNAYRPAGTAQFPQARGKATSGPTHSAMYLAGLALCSEVGLSLSHREWNHDPKRGIHQRA